MARPAPTLAAGNDLFMPGSGGDYRQALAALKGTDKCGAAPDKKG